MKQPALVSSFNALYDAHVGAALSSDGELRHRLLRALDGVSALGLAATALVCWRFAGALFDVHRTALPAFEGPNVRRCLGLQPRLAPASEAVTESNSGPRQGGARSAAGRRLLKAGLLLDRLAVVAYFVSVVGIAGFYLVEFAVHYRYMELSVPFAAKFVLHHALTLAAVGIMLAFNLTSLPTVGVFGFHCLAHVGFGSLAGEVGCAWYAAFSLLVVVHGTSLPLWQAWRAAQPWRARAYRALAAVWALLAFNNVRTPEMTMMCTAQDDRQVRHSPRWAAVAHCSITAALVVLVRRHTAAASREAVLAATAGRLSHG